jgi:cyclase
VVEWARRGWELGAGEILLTSVDREGTRKGFDVELVQAVTGACAIPVIASGGMGTLEHVEDVCRRGRADAVAVADALHYKRMDIPQIREGMRGRGIAVRTVGRGAAP